MKNYRFEKKFIVNPIYYDKIINSFELRGWTKIFSKRTVNNIYLDSLNSNSYYECKNGDLEKRKYRIRWYGNTFPKKKIVKTCFFETKIKKNDLNRKIIRTVGDIGIHLNQSYSQLNKKLFSKLSKIIPENINPNSYLPYAIPGIEILISIIFITIVGGLSLSFLGKRILRLIDDLFKRIPFLRTIYSAILQMTETFSKKDNDKKSVVLIEYPRKGVWAVGFATKENKGEMAQKTNQKLINVFVPTTPNPTSGFLLMFPIDDVIYLNMTFEEASKFIVSAGTSTGKN